MGSPRACGSEGGESAETSCGLRRGEHRRSSLSGWGANDALWTVVEAEDDNSHALLADWLDELPSVVDLAPGRRVTSWKWLPPF
ncbi:hypothetical protein ACFQ0G_29350 [Streptomyces chiangmaiensis]